MAKLAHLFFALLLSFIASAQRCPMDETYFDLHPKENQQFEDWIRTKRIQKLQDQSIGRSEAIVYQIPVVFHIIHNGEAIGTGTNIPDQRMIDQVMILNQDFRRTNPDRDLTPTAFLPVAADTEIEFVLAKRDPEGLPTTGIIRKQGSQTSYRFDEDAILKAESYWPAEEYLNIYVADLKDFLGWASFPFTNLTGINDINNNRLTDGIVVDYKFLGNNDQTGTFESLGRVASHEIGHFLGLRHVWGDGGCSASDFCNDTPDQSVTYINQCPSGTPSSCGSDDMYSNYMNYADDACLNIFTSCQSERMRIILENSPRRKSLVSSPALEDPIIVSRDLGIRSIQTPGATDCPTDIIPSIEVRNYGTDVVSSFETRFYINGILQQTLQSAIGMNPQDVAIVNFSEITLNSDLAQTFLFEIISVNGEQDQADYNNQESMVLPPSAEEVLPYIEDFESTITTFTSPESASSSLWSYESAPNETLDNVAASIQLYNEDEAFGEFDYLITRQMDFSAITSANLKFKYAYAQRASGGLDDGLIVAVSTDCGLTFPVENRIFIRYGAGLATSFATNQSFTPSLPTDWEEADINITKFTGNDNVRIAFIAHNASGNNLYIDDIEVSSSALEAYDIGLRSLDELSPVTCENLLFPSLTVKNHGFETINSLDVIYAVNGSMQSFQQQVDLLSGESTDIQFAINNLEDGIYDLEFSVASPNGESDARVENNDLSYHTVINSKGDFFPLREDFEGNTEWIITNEENNAIWSAVSIAENTAMRASGFSEESLGSNHWLVSPILTTNDLQEASLRFRYSYAQRGAIEDRLQVLVSNTCGRDYPFTVFNQNSSDLATTSSSESWIPQADEDWKEVFIDLSEYVIWSNLRIAFVFTNGNGNNLFVDDIEFFVSGDPTTPRFNDVDVTIFPNPAKSSFNVTLGLEEREDVTISLVDIAGKVVVQQDFKNALNQTIKVNAPAQAGFYFVRIESKSIDTAKRIFIQR
ncbi:MAG: choice-of-anchor J domain-containing protein [Cyclobacteriaceae bacterium]|nr:choice-of-anchor J domain-containing protein [Cyclobacteriaceae bacterium HetDA_MAG_MS6]